MESFLLALSEDYFASCHYGVRPDAVGVGQAMKDLNSRHDDKMRT